MSVNLSASRPLRARDVSREVALLDSAGVGSARDLVATRRRGPGAHREAGANPWRTGIRELVLALTWGQWMVFRPVHLAR